VLGWRRFAGFARGLQGLTGIAALGPLPRAYPPRWARPRGQSAIIPFRQKVLALRVPPHWTGSNERRA